MELCSRSETLGLEEAELIGLSTAIVTFRMREELRVRTPRSPPPPPPPEHPLPVVKTQDDVQARVSECIRFPTRCRQPAWCCICSSFTVQITDVNERQPVVSITQDLTYAPIVREAEEHGVTDEPVVRVATRERAPSPRHQGMYCHRTILVIVSIYVQSSRGDTGWREGVPDGRTNGLESC